MRLEIVKGEDMVRRSFLLSFMAIGLAACASPQAPIGDDGLPGQQVYRIRAQDADEIQFRMLDGLNALREAANAPTRGTNDNPPTRALHMHQGKHGPYRGQSRNPPSAHRTTVEAPGNPPAPASRPRQLSAGAQRCKEALRSPG